MHCGPLGYPPACIRTGFGSALGAALPYAVGHVVSNGSQDLCELSRPVIQVQRANAGQVSPQVSMDPRALNADQCTQVETCPGGICVVQGSHKVSTLQTNSKEVKMCY